MKCVTLLRIRGKPCSSWAFALRWFVRRGGELCVVRLRAPAIGRLHSCCDVGFYSITNLYFPGDQKPFWKAWFAFFSPRSSSLKISKGFKILTLECNFNQYWHFRSLCAGCCSSEWYFWDWKASCQRLQTNCHPVVISDVAISVRVLPDCTV